MKSLLFLLSFYYLDKHRFTEYILPQNYEYFHLTVSSFFVFEPSTLRGKIKKDIKIKMFKVKSDCIKESVYMEKGFEGTKYK